VVKLFFFLRGFTGIPSSGFPPALSQVLFEASSLSEQPGDQEDEGVATDIGEILA